MGGVVGLTLCLRPANFVGAARLNSGLVSLEFIELQRLKGRTLRVAFSCSMARAFLDLLYHGAKARM